MEATLERGCCEPAHPLMKPETVTQQDTIIQIVTPIEEPQAVPAADGEAEAILFKSPTCPNCKAAMALLDRAGVRYTAVNAADERALTEKYGVRHAPTLVSPHGYSFEKYRGFSDIKGGLMGSREMKRAQSSCSAAGHGK